MHENNRYLRWLSEDTPSIYWHDSAICREVRTALENGACGMTTNPFLIAATLQQNGEFWRERLDAEIWKRTGDDRAEALIEAVAGFYAGKLRQVRARGAGRGYCCAQTNPCRPADVEDMVRLAKRYTVQNDNIVVKMPATCAGIEAIEECAALGINVAATVSFTVPQVLAVAEAVQRGFRRARREGIEPGLAIAVIMVGRLDDYLRDVRQDTGSAAMPEDIQWAGTAVFKRAYEIFCRERYECVLMPAGCRGGYHIVELAGAQAIFSIAPRIADALARLEGPFEERIDMPVDPAILERLLTMREFQRAYEPDGMKREEFITFGPCNRTLDQFMHCGWNLLKAAE